jgi:hypothetical protein
MPGANATTTSTFAPNSLTAHSITRIGGAAMRSGDIPGNLTEALLPFNVVNGRWELLNPALDAAPWAIATIGSGAIALTVPAVPTLYDGLHVRFRLNTANSGAVTLNVNGLGAEPLVKQGFTALVPGDIRAGMKVMARYSAGGNRLVRHSPRAVALQDLYGWGRLQSWPVDLVFIDDAGAPVDLSAAMIAIQVRDYDGNLFDTPTVTVGGAPGSAVAAVDPATTATLPIRVLRMDVELVAGGQTLISDTVTIVVAGPVTQA